MRRSLRQQARDHARSLSRARDSQSALNAFDDLTKKTVALSARSAATIRSRIEGMRGNEEEAVLTEELREAIFGWLDTTTEAVEQWPLDPIDFSAIAAQLTAGYREARRRIPEDWSQATAEDLHELRQRVVDHRYQMELVEPLWPRHGRMWTQEAERLRDRLGRCQDLEILKRLTATASAAGALAGAAGSRLCRTHRRARASRRAHCVAPVRGKAEGVPSPAGDAVGARALDPVTLP